MPARYERPAPGQRVSLASPLTAHMAILGTALSTLVRHGSFLSCISYLPLFLTHPPCGRHRLLTIYLVQRAVQHRDHRVLSWLARSRDPRARRFVAACRHEVEHYHCRTGRLARTGYAAALLFRFRLLSSLRLSLAADITSLVVATIKHPTAFRTAVRIGGFIVLPRLAVLAAVKKAFARPVRNAWTKQSFVRTRRGASRQQAEGTVTALVCADRKYPGLHLRFDHL